jgi:hypothetical protein
VLSYLRHTFLDLSSARVAVGIFLLAFGVRLVAIFWFSLYQQPIAFNEMELIGRSLAENNTFANPYKIPTGPTAHGALIYPLLLSLIFRVWGYGVAARLALLVLSAAVSSLQYALLPAVASGCGLPRRFAVVAGLFGALVPLRLFTELDSWEACYLAAGWVVGVLILLQWWQHPSAKTSALCGVWWGLLFLLSPQMMVVFGLAMLARTWSMLRLRDFCCLRWQILTGTVAVIVVLPWIVHQSVQLGGLVLVRDNLPLELSVSNFPGASPFQFDNFWMEGGAQIGGTRHPHGSPAEAALVAEMGELKYERWRLQEVIGWVRQDPEEFLRRTTNRIRYFWFMPSDYPKWKDVIIFPMTALSFYGLYRLMRRAPAGGMILAVGYVGYPLVYYVTNLATRYRLPIEWAILFLASFALMERPFAIRFGRSWKRRAFLKRSLSVRAPANAPNPREAVLVDAIFTQASSEPRAQKDLPMFAAHLGELSALLVLQFQTEGRRDRVSLFG